MGITLAAVRTAFGLSSVSVGFWSGEAKQKCEAGLAVGGGVTATLNTIIGSDAKKLERNSQAGGGWSPSRGIFPLVRHSRAGGITSWLQWIPAFAGMTSLAAKGEGWRAKLEGVSQRFELWPANVHVR